MIAEWSKSLIGKKVKKENCSGIFTIVGKSGDSYAIIKDIATGSTGESNLSSLTLLPTTITDFKKEEAEILASLKEVQENIQFMEENHLEVYDEEIVKAYKAIKLFNLAGEDALEKAKQLINIINK